MSAAPTAGRRHLVIVQYGDYRDAVVRFAAGGPETYIAQRYSVEFVASLTERMAVTVVSFLASPHDEQLANGVRSIGFDWPRQPRGPRIARLYELLERLKLSDLLLLTPLTPALLWALLRGKRVLPMFADSFNSQRLGDRLRYRVLAAVLSSRAIPWISNHNVPASLDLVRIGVPASRVVPWDWPALSRPQDHAPKKAPAGPDPSLVFVGHVHASKGLGDVLGALARLSREGLRVKLSVIGSGADLACFENQATEQGIRDQVDFHGRVSNAEIVARMRMHDLVIVPSRHDAPEGLPMTIYEALCSRSPLLLSDHPMFVRAIDPDAAAFFRAADAADLARAIRELLGNPVQYQKLSEGSAAAWESIQCPVKWGQLIQCWLEGDPSDRARLAENTVDRILQRRSQRGP